MHRCIPYIICLSGLLSSSLGWADEAGGERQFYVGGGGGVGPVTTHNTSETVKFSSKLGFTAGLLAGWRVSSFAAIQMETSFSSKGADVSGGGASGRYSRSYVELPLLFKIVAPLSDRVAPYASLGPALGILLQAETNLEDGRHIDLTDRTERIDVGIMVGVGASVDVGRSGAVYVDARYHHGLRNYNKVAVSEDGEARNRAFYVTVGYQTDLSVFSGGRE